MDQKQRESWERVRSKGELRYTLFYGGVVWGIPIGLFEGIIHFVVELFMNHFSLSFLSLNYFGFAIFSLGFFYFSGCVLGFLMWNSYEKKYQRTLANQSGLNRAQIV